MLNISNGLGIQSKCTWLQLVLIRMTTMDKNKNKQRKQGLVRIWIELCSLCTHFHQGFVSWMNVDFYQFCIYWHDHVVLILSFVDVVYHINWFAWFELSLWPWGESSLVVVYDLFYVLNSGCWYFKNFCVYLSRILTCNLLFWWCLCLVSVTSLPNFRVMVTS